jgi:Flp pilus assembly protein TadD
MAADRQKPKPEKRMALLPALLFFLVLCTFLPCLRNGFVSIDDPIYVSQNPQVSQGLTWESLKWAWGSTEAQNWHPLTWMSHLLDVQLFGLNPWGHHATSVVLHALNTALLFLLLRRMTGARWRSFAVAAVFGLHPLRVESVAWISERKDVLSVCFWLLATWAYVRYAATERPKLGPRSPTPEIRSAKSEIRNPKIKGSPRAEVQGSRLEVHPLPSLSPASRRFWYWTAVGLFACGLLCKPMLVTLPFALWLFDYWPLRRWPQTPVKGLLLEKIPFLALAAASSVVTYVVQARGGAVTPMDTLGLSARLGNALVSYARYVGMSVWPVDLCAIYPHPGHWPAATVAAAGVALAVVSALTLWRRQTQPYLAVGWFWFLGTLVPAIGLVQVGRQALADRYTYIPSIGLWLAVVWGADKLTESWRHRETLARVVVVTAMIVCILLTVRQIGYWRDTNAMYARAQEVTQRNCLASSLLTRELERNGEVDKAVAMYQEALQINPYRTEVRCDLADLLLKQRRPDEALAQFQKAVALDPGDFWAHERLGGLCQNLGRLDEAVDELNQAIRLKPDYADAYSDLGNCYGLKGRPDDAIRCFEQAVKLKPSSAQNHRELGVGLANLGRWAEAIDQFQQTLQLDPSDAQARVNLNAALQEQAKTEKGGNR